MGRQKGEQVRVASLAQRKICSVHPIPNEQLGNKLIQDGGILWQKGGAGQEREIPILKILKIYLDEKKIVTFAKEVFSLYLPLLRPENKITARQRRMFDKSRELSSHDKARLLMFTLSEKDLIHSWQEGQVAAAYFDYLAMNKPELVEGLQREDVRLSGQLHDIGKSMKPLRIIAQHIETLRKAKGSGDRSLEAILARHPEYGAHLFAQWMCLLWKDKKVEWKQINLKTIFDGIRYHHYDFNRPNGLGEIPKPAKILRIVDRFVAMNTKNKPETLPYKKACDAIKEGANKEYDPEYAEYFEKFALDENNRKVIGDILDQQKSIDALKNEAKKIGILSLPQFS